MMMSRMRVRSGGGRGEDWNMGGGLHGGASLPSAGTNTVSCGWSHCTSPCSPSSPPQDQASLPAPCPKLVDEGRLTTATRGPAANSSKQPMTGPSSGPGRASRFLAMQQEARKGITASTTTATAAAGQPLRSAAVSDVPESLSLELCTQAELAPGDADMAAAAAEGAEEEEEEEEVGGSELDDGRSTV